MTPAEKRELEMNRGAQVLIEKHGARALANVLAQAFDPDYVPDQSDNEGARPSRENKAYRARMQAQVHDR